MESPLPERCLSCHLLTLGNRTLAEHRPGKGGRAAGPPALNRSLVPSLKGLVLSPGRSQAPADRRSGLGDRAPLLLMRLLPTLGTGTCGTRMCPLLNAASSVPVSSLCSTPRGPWGLVQAQVAAGTARGKGPLLDSAKEGLGLRKTWFRTLTHPRPLHPGHPGHDSGCSPHPPSLFSQLQNRG